MNARQARARRSAKQPLTSRAIQLIEEARTRRNEAVIAARKAGFAAITKADREMREETRRATKQMNDEVEAIKRSDRSGIFLAQRIEEP